jgi:uncharacterized membrane protein
MFDLPLHPIAVHFPIVLGVILPIVALAIWWAIRKEYFEQKAWVLVVFIALAYGVSSFVAVELGERDEDKVEKVVSEKVIEEHEEAGESIPWIATGLFLISLAGFSFKNSNRFRLALGVLSLAAIIPLANTGHTGGKLVYQYGAANAHLSGEYKTLVESGKFYVENAKSEDHEEEEDDDDH